MSATREQVEAGFVFLPYYWRPLFPKTAFSTANKNRERNTDPGNIDFYTKNTYVIKTFYNFAKHYIGFFLNYARFMDRVDVLGEGHEAIRGIPTRVLDGMTAVTGLSRVRMRTLAFFACVGT